jgi:hypothetical protein
MDRQQVQPLQLSLADSTPPPLKDLTNSVARLQLGKDGQQEKPGSSATPCTPAHQLNKEHATPCPPYSALMADSASAMTPLSSGSPCYEAEQRTPLLMQAHTPEQATGAQLLQLAAHPGSPTESEDTGEDCSELAHPAHSAGLSGIQLFRSTPRSSLIAKQQPVTDKIAILHHAGLLLTTQAMTAAALTTMGLTPWT